MEGELRRFGEKDDREIDADITKNVPENTKRSRDSVWRQFSLFLEEKGYKLEKSTSSVELNTILKSWACNMKKKDGTDYKEGVVKHMWNSTAKMIQDKYFTTWNISINPFNDIIFKSAREARDATRKKLQILPEKRTASAAALSEEEYAKIIELLDENTPEGLQKKFYFLASYELAWRGGEGAQCKTIFFKEELDNRGCQTGRIEYNPIFSKTAQGGAKKLTESKWLIANQRNVDMCPVRIYNKLMSKRTANIKTDRMFLTPNPYWNVTESSHWYKNCPVGIHEIGKWVKCEAEKSGLDTKKRKISNHSIRCSAVSVLAKAGVQEQQLMKITGHNNSNSIKSYLQLDREHHQQIVEKMRSSVAASHSSTNVLFEDDSVENIIKETGLLQNCSNVSFSNCTFHFDRK